MNRVGVMTIYVVPKRKYENRNYRSDFDDYRDAY